LVNRAFCEAYVSDTTLLGGLKP